MESFLSTFLSILLVELTDKTRFVALLLSARYKAPFQLITGMTLGYIPAIALAIFASGAITHFISPNALRWLVAITFLGFGVYLLLSREGEEGHTKPFSRFERLGPFWVGLILVAITEFADKSQFATAGMMIKYQKAWPVFGGSLSAQTLLNVVYVTFGRYVGGRIPVRVIQWVAGAAFLIFGVLALVP